MIGLKRWGIQPNSVEVILLTHLHGDHFGGLPFFLLDAQLVSKRTQPLTVAGPPGTARRVRETQEVLFPGSSQAGQKFPVRYLEWTDRTPTQIGELVSIPYEVVHASGAVLATSLIRVYLERFRDSGHAAIMMMQPIQHRERDDLPSRGRSLFLALCLL